MEIVVFGSTGAAGRELVARALAAGYQVTAFTRSPEKLQDLHGARLRVVEGRLNECESIDCAVAGADAVISLVGPGFKVAQNELSDGMANIVSAMKKNGVKRLVSISTASVKDERDRYDFASGILVGMVRIGIRGAYDEIIRMSEVVRSSSLDWTLVRVGLLSDGPARPVRVGYYGHGEVHVAVSRASLAKFMLDQVWSAEYVGKSPAISN